MKKTLVLIAGFVVLAGCGKQKQAREAAPGKPEVAEREATRAPSGSAGGSLVSTSSPEELSLPSRKVAYTVSVVLETKKFDDVLGRINSIPEKYQGYMVSSQIYTREYRAREALIVMKVPSDRLSEAENDLKAMKDVKMESYDKTSQDVTEEYLDLSIRLENKKRLAERLRQLLNRATGVSDAMSVERELARVTEEIERMEGRMRYLENITSYSQLNITLHEPYPTPVGSEGGPIKILKKSLRYGGTLFAFVIAGLIVLIGGLLPVAILGLIIWLIVWAIVRARRGRKKSRA